MYRLLNQTIMKSKITILLFFALLRYNAQVINTIAGNGTPGSSGDGFLATTAQLGNPRSVCVDASGNTYIADFGANVIRKINSSTGIITTVAGNGSAGYSGDGNLAINASFSFPTSICVDPLGNLYISDVGNNRIRKVNTSGIVTTIAGTGAAGYSGDGGAASSAKINGATGLFFSNSGYILFADKNNNRVRKILLPSGIISTIAGNGTAGFSGDNGSQLAAQLNAPNGVCEDQTGTIYIADLGNNRIRNIDFSQNKIFTYAGIGSVGNTGDGGPALFAKFNSVNSVSVDESNNIYIADNVNHSIRKIDYNSKIISRFAGNYTSGYSGDGLSASNAQLNAPCFAYSDIGSNIFICDAGNYVVRKINGTPSIANFNSVATGCIGAVINFTNTSVNANSYLWNFGDGGTSTNTNPSHSYSAGGLYTVQLITRNSNGNDTINKLIDIDQVVATITPSTSTNLCYGKSLTLSSNYSSGNTWYRNNIMVGSGQSFTVVASTAGNYQLSVTNTCGAHLSNTISISVIPSPTVIAQSTNALICLGENVVLTGSGANSYTWTNGVSDNVAFSPSITTTYIVTGTSLNGCVDSDNVTVQVNTCTGIKEITNTNSFIIYPNPTSVQLNISGLDKNQNFIILTDLLGKTINKINSNNAESISINIENLSPGVYFISANNKCYKFIKE